MRRRISLILLGAALISAQTPGNQADRLERFRDQGFGLFIHWSVDSQLGTVISHSLAGASEDYTSRFFSDLPKTFNPRKFHPEDWAVLAKLAGVRYVVFTAKHHSGQPAFAPPRVETNQAVRTATGVTLQGTLHALGDAASVEVRFEYRSLKGLDTNERSGEWQSTPFQRMDSAGKFSAQIGPWEAGEPYEFRAEV